MSLETNKVERINLNEMTFENVTYQEPGRDPILHSVDFVVPMDQTIIIESSRPQNAVQFLAIISGRKNLDSGRIVLNSQKTSFDEFSELNPQCIGCFFESEMSFSKTSFEKIWNLNKNSEEFKQLVEHFDLALVLNQDFQKLSFGWQKLAWLVRSVISAPELLVLEDPAVGLTEKQWLDFLDYVQFIQRRGSLRHIFMTNNHPTAMRHLAFNKIYLEDGLIYFDEEAGYKKASHF